MTLAKPKTKGEPSVPKTEAPAPDEQEDVSAGGQEVVNPKSEKPKRTRKRKRQKKSTVTKHEFLGCGCPAKIIMRVEPDNSVVATFYGYHNHDVQYQYLIRHVNPIHRSVHVHL